MASAGGINDTVRRRPALWSVAIVLLPAALVFAFHARWIVGHFSTDGYLCDSGWLAFLFERADPALRNPRAVVGHACAGLNAPTFLAHHLSPHLFLFGAPFAWSGVSGVTILAYHQGLFFALVCAAFVLVATSTPRHCRERPAILAMAIAVGATANMLLQAAAYPHYETALTGISALAIAAWVTGRRRLFIGCLLWLPLIREDGGLFAAVVCLSCLAMISGDENPTVGRPRLAVLAGGAMAVSAAAFIGKALFFPGFAAFAKNFAGDGWNHVTFAFVRERAWMTMINGNIGPVLIGSFVLARFDRRYLTGVTLLGPLLLVHMLSIRPEHGQFTLYYALPFVLPVLLWLVVLVRRTVSREATTIEQLIAVSASLILTTPAQALIGTPQQRGLVVRQVFERSIADIRAMAQFARSVRRSDAVPAPAGRARHCASMGIAALIPDDLAPEEVVAPDSRLAECRTLLLLRADMHYAQLTDAAETLGFRNVLQRENAQLWMPERD